MARHTFFCIDGHTCGNPVRVVTGGSIPALEGATMFERRQHFLSQHDWIRTGLMFEPRGHDMMSGSILYPPTRDDCDVGILFIETSGCLPMCGHGTIGTVTIALENGLIQPKVPGVLRLDTPAGLVEARYVQNGPFIELGADHQRAVLPLRRGLRSRGRGARQADHRRGLWRQFLRHRRAAGALFGPRRREPFGHPALEPEAAQRLQRLIRDRPPREPGHQPAHPRAVDRQGPDPAGNGTQRGLLRRQGDRPLALRHRHLGPHGPSCGQGRARRGRGVRARNRSSSRPSPGASRAAPRSAITRRSSPRSRAGPG